MNYFRYYLMLLIGVFFLVGFLIIAGSLFLALLPVIVPITILLIIFALLSGRKRTVVFTAEKQENERPVPPASQDTIDISAIEVKDDK